MWGQQYLALTLPLILQHFSSQSVLVTIIFIHLQPRPIIDAFTENSCDCTRDDNITQYLESKICY